MTSHFQDHGRHRQSGADPESPRHVEQFGTWPGLAAHRLERHTAYWAVAGCIPPNLRMHRACIDGALLWGCRFGSFAQIFLGDRLFHTTVLEPHTLRGYIGCMQAAAKASMMKRLKRIEGQVRGLARMVEDDRYCIDIITQISAVRAALRRAEEEILADHVTHCVEDAIASGNKAEQRRKVTELTTVLRRAER